MSIQPLRILPLTATVANQIAAGEVIERPASIVKELLENSIDAGATSVIIDIGFGGLNQIKISDNGVGIVADDLPLAVMAHATSKLKKLVDLYAITSMGFRGEALASIASVAKLTISSKPCMQAHGMILHCYPKPYQLLPIARNQGTTVDVCDIFFNTPVRKKFLKTQRTEFQAIDQIVRRFALSVPNIAIQLSHNGKSHLHLPNVFDESSRLLRLIKLLGRQFVDQSIYIDSQHQTIRLHGWVSSLHYQRSQSDKLWIYINNRMVRDRLVNHAIKQAYEGLLYPGRHPTCLLYLTMNPGEVDVNVHPTKHEVRFQQARLIHDFISTQIRSALVPSTHAALPVLPVSNWSTPPSDYQSTKLQLRESYITDLTSSENEAIGQTTDKPKWLPLNNRFAICYLQQQPYLVDIMLLQRHWLVEELGRKILPLASRPLLVSLRINKPAITSEKLSNIQTLLQQLGIRIEIDGDTLVVDTLPVVIPNLMIKSFLLALFTLSTLTIKGACQLLACHQTFIMTQISDEQRDCLLVYLQGLTANPFNFAACLKQLSEQACHDYINQRLIDRDLLNND
jgi:DNA mismatch repair protein MutL